MIKTVEFIKSFAKIETYKEFSGQNPCPEICVVGRSNVGKSSFINMISGRKIAKISSTPGRTRLINIFSVNGGEYNLVDLPGYGYAKASKAIQREWGGLIEDYLLSSEQLLNVFSLIDSRHPPTALDKQMIAYLYHYGLPFTIIATKSDKLSKSEISRNIQTIASELKVGKDNIITTSAEKRTGKEAVYARISDIMSDITDNSDA